MWRRLSLVILCSGVIALFATFSSPQAQPNYNAAIEELARQLNLWRITQGLGPLVYNESLERMAAQQADYLLSLPQLPGDLHQGPTGEYPRERSQLDQFAWPVYGDARRMSVTEIAAIGSIDSAIAFWRGSDVHNRSVTNPAYREVGIAARPFGTDTLYIVVLGGRPGVLPVLVDVDNEDFYLTTELIEWQGAWIGDAVDYRFLDADEQPLTDWTPWERILDIAELEITDELVFIQYRDDGAGRATHEIIFNPVWSSVPVPQAALDRAGTPVPPTATPTLEGLLPSATPTSGAALAFATNTPAILPSSTSSPAPSPTPFPTFTPTATPLPGSVVMLYNENVFTLFNAGASPVDLTGISFLRDDIGIGFIGSFWEEVSDILNLEALPPNQCLMVQPESGIVFDAPPQCTLVRSIVQEPDPRYFWLAEFDVMFDGVVMQTCPGQPNGDTCDLLVQR